MTPSNWMRVERWGKSWRAPSFVVLANQPNFIHGNRDVTGTFPTGDTIRVVRSGSLNEIQGLYLGGANGGSFQLKLENPTDPRFDFQTQPIDVLPESKNPLARTTKDNIKEFVITPALQQTLTNKNLLETLAARLKVKSQGPSSLAMKFMELPEHDTDKVPQ